MHFPIEFLNSLEVSGFSLHLLSLKLAAPIIILRSLDHPRVTNGTRCVITKLSANTIEARISHGRFIGHDIIIPCIPLIPSNSTLPFEFRRLQFPVVLCFAMTINKSQGQTFKAVGVDLTNESFTHGMLYVVQVGSSNCLTLFVREGFIKHVMLFIMRFLIKFVYCLSAALCTVLWINGKIFNVSVLLFSKKTKKPKNEKN